MCGAAVIDAALAAYIVEEARSQGLDAEVALAFAIAETGVANTIGDQQLYQRRGYMDAVRQQHPRNPDIDKPEQWVSYGPFQLQARWFIREGERPSLLLDEKVSVPRAIRHIRGLLHRYKGDVDDARLAYVCGTPENCTDEKRKLVLRRYREAEQKAARWLQEHDEVSRKRPLVAGIPSRVMLGGVLVAVAIWVLMGGHDDV